MTVPLLLMIISLTVAAPASALPPILLDTNCFVYLDAPKIDDQDVGVKPPYIGPGSKTTLRPTGALGGPQAPQAQQQSQQQGGQQTGQQGQQGQQGGQAQAAPSATIVQPPSEAEEWIKPRSDSSGTEYRLVDVDSAYPKPLYWLPYFSLLSYLDARGRLYVIPAAASPYLRHSVLKAIQRRAPGILVMRLPLTDPSEMPSVVDFAAKLGYTHLITVIAEFDPLALSSALALKWQLLEEYCRKTGLDPVTVGVVIVAVGTSSARVKLTGPGGSEIGVEYVTVMAPILPNAAVIDVTDLDPEQCPPPQFLDNFDQLLVGGEGITVDEIVVVYRSDAFREYLERYLRWLSKAEPTLKGKAVRYVRALPDILRGSFAAVLSPPGTAGRRGLGAQGWGEAVQHFYPWPAAVYLAAVYGIPIVWMTRDVQAEGVRWEGFLFIWGPKPQNARYWDFTTEFTQVIPRLLQTGPGLGQGATAPPTTLLSYATVVDGRGNSAQVGAPVYLFSLPFLAAYPWDLIAVDLNTSTLALMRLGALATRLSEFVHGAYEEVIALCGPYLVIAECEPAGTRIIEAWKAFLTRLLDRAERDVLFRRLLRDVRAVGPGLNLAMELIKGHYLRDVRRVIESTTGSETNFRSVVFFGLALSGGETRTEPLAVEFDGLDEHFRVLIGRGDPPRVSGPCLQAQVCDVYTVLEWWHSRARRSSTGVWWWVCALAWCCWRWWSRRRR
ncbi:MAG: hypothetical protein ABGY09_03440 [Euryarchaeota archaeon]